MRNFLTALIVLPLAAILIVFATANREVVTVSLDPFSSGPASQYAIDLPLFIVMFACVMLGVLIGGVADWLKQGRYRREARDNRQEVRRLQHETESMRRSNAALQARALPAPSENSSRAA